MVVGWVEGESDVCWPLGRGILDAERKSFYKCNGSACKFWIGG